MPNTSHARRTFVVTGGNSGLGYATAKHIAAQGEGNHVVLACRDAGKADDAVRSLTAATGHGNVSAMDLDLASLDSVRGFAAAFGRSGLPPLYALVCNAGVIQLDAMHHTADGFESTFGINHLGHFLLATLLAGNMAETGRIVFVASATHDPAAKTRVPAPVYQNARLLAYPPDTNEPVRTAGMRRYSTSKLCNIYCAYELAERLHRAGTRIDVNAFDPGEMPGTGFSRSFPAPMRLVAKYVNYAQVPFRSGVHTPSQSGRALAQLVTNPDLDAMTGRYVDATGQKRSSELSYDVDNRKDLWRTGVELSRLSPAETVVSLG